MLEIRTNPLRLFLQGTQMPQQFALHSLRRADRLARVHARFQIGIQVFVRVQLRRIAGQVKQFNLLGMLFQPRAYPLGVMNAQVIDDQKDLLARVLAQALEKRDERICTERLAVEPEAQRALVGDGANEVDPATFGLREHQHRRLAARGVASRVVLHTARCRLISPTNLGAFRFGASNDDRVLILEPFLNSFRTLLISAFDRALGRETPARQVLAHRTNRQIDQEHLLDYSTHRLSAPQRKFQLQLIRRSVYQLFLDALFLCRRQGAAHALGATVLSVLQSRIATLRMRLGPVVHRQPIDPQLRRNRRLAMPATQHPNDRATQLVARRRFKFSDINLFHARSIRVFSILGPG
jgi:hypothetical protein